LIVSNLPKFHTYLSLKTKTNNKPTVTMPLPSGEFEPLGFYRLKVIEFFAILIITNHGALDAEIMKLGVLSTCLNLFFQYPWNNFLHSTVEQVVQTILDGENEELKLHLLKDAKLLDGICEASKENDEELTKPKGVRRGYMGHLTSMSTSIINIASSTPSIEKLLTSNEKWNAYVNGALASTQAKMNRSLAYMPSDFAVDEGEEVDDYDENGEDYSPEEQDFRLEQDDDDEDDDDEEEEGVVIQSRRIDDGEEDQIEQEEEWEEREIEDRGDETQQQKGEESTNSDSSESSQQSSTTSESSSTSEGATQEQQPAATSEVTV
jgi:serine/threonine-protein phosphatase 6 regulatory subunit 3